MWVLQSERSLIRFPSGHVPGLWVGSLVRVHMRGNPSMLLSLSFSLPSPLKIYITKPLERTGELSQLTSLRLTASTEWRYVGKYTIMTKTYHHTLK